MKKIWEFFENMDECMYVADIDTHELIYMNKSIKYMDLSLVKFGKML